MDLYFLVIYKNENNKEVVRTLTEKTLTHEVELATIDYFQIRPFGMKCTKTRFHTFLPVGGEIGAYDFVDLDYVMSGDVPKGEMIRKFLDDDPDISELYTCLSDRAIDNALSEYKQYEACHHATRQ